MPPTMSVVINRSEAASVGSNLHSLPKVKPRTYDDKPLPIRASDHAPRSATIVSRVFEGGVVTFELKIGETVLPDVGLDEVLDYVSAYHLEEFENKEFQQEEELMRIAEEEDRRFKEEQDARRRERAKTKGVVVMQDTSSEGMDDAMEDDVNTGKHGRARPSYKKQFKQQRRRRRRRDEKTGELLPLSDDDDMGVEQESSSDDRFESKPEPDSISVSLDNLPKRRRRKRDPITNELLPLEPIEPESSRSATVNKLAQKTQPAPLRFATVNNPSQQIEPDYLEKAKRPRRRRHPITNELMPLGWRYDPEEERRQQRNGIKVPSMQRLSISNESEPKRRRLDRTVSSNELSASPNRAQQSTTRGAGVAPLSAFKHGNVIDLMDSDSDDSAEDSIDVKPAAPKPKLLRRGVGGAAGTQSIAKSQTPSESPGPSTLASLPVRFSPKKPGAVRKQSASSNSSIIPLQVDGADSEESEEEAKEAAPPPTKPVTSIMHPSAITEDPSSSDEDTSDDEDLPEDEFFVEDILRHALSNPLTHPDHLGKQPVMLYEVKWAGFPDTTWEPETSFASMDVVREYQRRKGMK